MAKVGQLGCA